MDDIVTRVRIHDFMPFNRGTAVIDVANKHIWKIRHTALSSVSGSAISVTCTTLNLHTSAILVEFPVTDKIDPGPGQQSLVRGRREAGYRKIVGGTEWASANDRFDDTERSAIVIRQRYLTRSTHMSCRSCECYIISLTCNVSSFDHTWIIIGHIRIGILIVFASKI